MQQNNQGTQTSESRTSQNADQDQQSTSKEQQNSPRNQSGNSSASSPNYSAQKGEDEKDDSRQDDAGQGTFTSQRNSTGEDSDEDRPNGGDINEGSRPDQQFGKSGQEKGKWQDQQKSGNNQGNKGGNR